MKRLKIGSTSNGGTGFPLINFKTITEEIHNNGGKINSKTINNNTSKDLSENGKIPVTRQKAVHSL